MIENIVKDINVVKINCSILKVQVRKKRMSPYQRRIRSQVRNDMILKKSFLVMQF